MMKRLNITFLALVAIATLALAALTDAIGRQASPLTGVTVAASGVVLAAALGLGMRLLILAERSTRR